jgi:uncharacterized protein YdaU (DUF1376 family)
MHYYQFNIGDYASHTRHLDLLEDLAYRRILDLYYLHERPLNADASVVAKQIGMRDDAATVRDVLNEFFVKTEDGYVNARADKEIAHYKSKVEQASRAGKASAERRLNSRSTDVATDVQLNNKQETITNKHKTIKQKATDVVMPEGISQSVWDEFIAHRKAKKAKVTQLVIEGIGKEASKAGWSLEDALKETIVRNWQSFKADWVAVKPQMQNKWDVANVTTPPPPNQDAALRKIEADRKNAVPPSLETLAKLAELRKSVA